MRISYSHCAGIDVHKKMVMVCRIIPDGQAGWAQDTRQFWTTTQELLKLADWLQAGEVRQVALESTGVY